MFKSEEARKAAEILSDQIGVMKEELKDFQVKCGGEVPTDPTLEEEVIQKINETEVLKKSAPDGNVDDPNVQYFLAFAELEKSNTALRQQEAMVHENIKGLEVEIQSTNALLKEFKEMSKALTHAANEGNTENNINEVNCKKSNQKAEVSDVDNKIRATRKIYKEFKSFLSEYLERVDPVKGETGGQMSIFLQHLWQAYQKKGFEYVELSALVSHYPNSQYFNSKFFLF